MNFELKNKMEAIISMLDGEIGKLKNQYNKLRGDYENHVEGVTAAQINEVAREAKRLVEEKKEVVADLNAYERAYSNKGNNYRNFVILENDLAKKYEVELIEDFEEVAEVEKDEAETQNRTVEEPKVVYVQKEEKKNHTVRDMIIGAIIAGTAIGVTSCAIKNDTFGPKKVTTQLEETEDEHKSFIERMLEGLYLTKDEQKEEPAVQAPTEAMEDGDVEYGVVDDAITQRYGHLTDASDEAQVRARAEAIYKNHVDLPNVPAAAKAEMSIETIENMIRVSNGELAIIDGKPYYEEDIMDVLANDFATYYNMTSFKQFGTDLQYAPVSVFFEEDTLAYESAKMHDEYAARIYADIRAGQVEQFRQDSVSWGEFLRDTFVYNDATGYVPSIWQMDTPSMFPVASAIISVYGPSIQEYALGVDLARRDNTMYDDTFGICVPFCYNEHNELTYVPLSKLLYDINYTPMNSLARSAGMYEQWASEHTPITVNLWVNSNDFMTDKYEREVGFGRTLK